jgi:glycine betaine/proline transport system permease protein
MDFPEGWRIPIAGWINDATDWIVIHWGGFFDAIGDGLLWVMLRIEDGLLWLPWYVVVILVGLAGWWVLKRWYAGLLLSGFLVIIGTFGLWEDAATTLALVITSVILSLIFGIPTGILMSRSSRIENIIKPILDTMQTMPSFVYLVPALLLLGLGLVPAVFATVIYAAPPVIRLTNAGLRQVSASVIEAATSFGATRRQILVDVQLPLAVPTILVGINQTTMMALAMVVIAALIGAGGLGLEVYQGLQRLDVGRAFAGGISIVLLAIIIDRLTNAFATRQRIQEE